MSKILVIFTGGTIGSKKNSGAIDVHESATYELIQRYQDSPSGYEEVEFDSLQPMYTLSENMNSSHWVKLIQCLASVAMDDYSGIIITHGSDTLPYTAAAISYAYNHAEIPIVLIAGNYPLEDERSNGLANFASSVDFIMEHGAAGVFAVFENNRGESVVYLGTRMHQASHFTDQYGSPYEVPYGWMRQGCFMHNADPLNPAPEHLRSMGRPKLPPALHFSSEIVYVRPYPGLMYSYFNFENRKPAAVLHDLYHSGTACAEGEAGNYSILEFIRDCKLAEVPLYIAPLNRGPGERYASSERLVEAGAIPIVNTSVEAALVKLMLACGTFESEPEIRSLMTGDPLYFEVIK